MYVFLFNFACCLYKQVAKMVFFLANFATKYGNW